MSVLQTRLFGQFAGSRECPVKKSQSRFTLGSFSKTEKLRYLSQSFAPSCSQLSINPGRSDSKSYDCGTSNDCLNPKRYARLHHALPRIVRRCDLVKSKLVKLVASLELIQLATGLKMCTSVESAMTCTLAA